MKAAPCVLAKFAPVSVVSLAALTISVVLSASGCAGEMHRSDPMSIQTHELREDVQAVAAAKDDSEFLQRFGRLAEKWLAADAAVSDAGSYWILRGWVATPPSGPSHTWTLDGPHGHYVIPDREMWTITEQAAEPAGSKNGKSASERLYLIPVGDRAFVIDIGRRVMTVLGV